MSLEPHPKDNKYVNVPESKSFFQTVLTWHGSVTPRVLPRVLLTTGYAVAVSTFEPLFPWISWSINPFEYSGAVLALILVLRVNAGHDRWWEARKIWGTIVNQSRNLALVVYTYGNNTNNTSTVLLRWIAAWPHVVRESLRNEIKLGEVKELLGDVEASKICAAENKPMYVAYKMMFHLNALKQQGMDPMAFLRAETERSQLIDALGACERIRNTNMPFVLAIKTRRIIFLFLLLLPLALVERVGWLTPLVIALASYPLFSLDEIGAELQNPFSQNNLSHLPLDQICKTIATNVMGLTKL